MRHARSDYDRIQDPAVNDPSLLPPGGSPIGQDEPVFLLRANDQCSSEVLLAWADENDAGGGDPALSEHVRQWADVMTAWRHANGGGKMPDVPTECLRSA